MTSSTKLNVIIVDDEPGMRETLVDILETVGYNVSAAVDGEQALEAVRTNDVDIVVMDVQMPKRDGVSVLQQLNPPPPTVIMMTAYAIEERLRAAVDGNAFAILHKPFAVGRLLSILESAAGNAA